MRSVWRPIKGKYTGKWTVLIVLFCISNLFSCDTLSEWSEDRNGYRRTDSLFLGMYLGMPEKEFYDHCTELNKQQLITQGGGAVSVEYKMREDFDSPVTMRFFPTFVEGKIFEMPVTYHYPAWAPWNKQYQASVLLEEMLEKYKGWYGEDFKLLNHHTQGKVYYKIDGRRRINLFVMDDQFVQAVFTDLKTEKTLKEAYREKLKNGG
jgi:hypothetical protein